MEEKIFELNLRKGRDLIISHHPFIWSLLVFQMPNKSVGRDGIGVFFLHPILASTPLVFLHLVRALFL